MSNNPSSFLDTLLINDVLSKTMSLVGEPQISAELRSLILDIRKIYLSAKLLSKDLSRDEQEEKLSLLTKVAFVVEDLAIDGLAEKEKSKEEDIQQALVLAGLIFEYAGDFFPNSHSAVKPFNWYLHSAICYSLGHYEANSAVLASVLSKYE